MAKKFSMRGFLKRAEALGLTVALLISLFSVAQAQRLERVRYGHVPIANFLAMFVAQDRGYFEEEGIKAEPQEIAIPAVPPALAAGSLEVGFLGYLAVFMSREGGFDLHVIAPVVRDSRVSRPDTSSGYESPQGLAALEESGIRTLKDLKGKTIAVSTIKRSIEWLFVAEVLSRQGLDPTRDVTWIEIPYPRMGPMLRGKQAQAVWLVDPFLTIEQAAGGIRVVSHAYSEVSTDPPVEIAGLVSSRAWIDKNPQLTERFVRAYRKGFDYIEKNPRERSDLIAKYTKLKQDLVNKMPPPGFARHIDVKGLQLVFDLALKWGLIKKKEDVGKFLYATALK